MATGEQQSKQETRRIALARLNNLLRDVVEDALRIPGVTLDDVIRVLREVDKECASMAKCGECGGTGEIVNDGPYSPCDDCNGTGAETHGYPFTLKCDECGGSGRR